MHRMPVILYYNKYKTDAVVHQSQVADLKKHINDFGLVTRLKYQIVSIILKVKGLKYDDSLNFKLNFPHSKSCIIILLRLLNV